MAKSKGHWSPPPGGFNAVMKEIRSLPGMMAALDKEAAGIAARAGAGFEARPSRVTGGRGRGRAEVVAVTQAAQDAEARDHTLLKAADGG